LARKIKQYRRKDLVNEPDEFLTFTERSIEWSRSNWPTLIIAVGVIAVAGVVGLLIRSSAANARMEFQNSLMEAITTYNSPVEGQGIQPTPGVTIFPDQKQKYDAALFKLDKLYKEHSGSEVAPYLRTYIADSYFNEGDYDKAIQEYTNIIQSLPPNSDLALIARNNMGVAYYLKGKYDQAYPIFKELADSKNPLNKASAIIYAGRCAERLGKADEAIKYYKRAVASYSDSTLTNGLKETISKLRLASGLPEATDEVSLTPQSQSTKESQSTQESQP